jgi:Sulfate permease family
MRPNDKTWWEKAFPAAEWLRSYHRAWFRLDLLAGITLAAYLLPAALGDASLARLPPQAGLYACLFGGLVFWIFCGSRQTAISVTSAISLVIGASLRKCRSSIGNLDREILIPSRYKEARKKVFPACVRRTPYCGMSEMVEGAAQIRTSLTREKRNLTLTTLPLIRALQHSAVPTCASRLTSYNPER